MQSMCTLSVRSIPAFKELSALARITCAPTASARSPRNRGRAARPGEGEAAFERVEVRAVG